MYNRFRHRLFWYRSSQKRNNARKTLRRLMKKMKRRMYRRSVFLRTVNPEVFNCRNFDNYSNDEVIPYQFLDQE